MVRSSKRRASERPATRHRNVSTLRKLFDAGDLDPDPHTNLMMMVAAEIWLDLALADLSSMAPSGIAIRERVSTSRTLRQVDNWLANGIDRREKSNCYRYASRYSCKYLDAIIVEDLTIKEAALKLLGRDNGRATDEMRGRFKQALLAFSGLCRLGGT